MLSPMNVVIARTDISIAETLAQKGDLTIAEINMIAYHATQAIEKCLKAIVEAEYNPKEPIEVERKERVLYSHDFNSILFQIQTLPHRNFFCQDHRFIHNNSERLSKLNNLRYGGNMTVDRDDAMLVLNEAKIFYKEIEEQCIQQCGSKEQVERIANQEFSKATKIMLYNSNANTKGKGTVHNNKNGNKNKKPKRQRGDYDE